MKKKIITTINTDSWKNILTGQGTSLDKNESKIYIARHLLTQKAIEHLYTDEGIAKQIADKPVNMIFKAGFTVNGDTDNSINATIDERKYYSELSRVFKWSRAFGGAVLYLAVNDGNKDLKTPLDENNIKEILFVKAFDRYRIGIIEYNQDINSKEYGKPLYITINPIKGGSFTIHSSRCIIVDGEDTCESVRERNNGWGLSIFQNNYSALADLNTIYHSISHIIQGYTQDIIKMENLLDLIHSGKSNLVKDRLNIIDLCKHIMNSVLLDTTESMERLTSTLTGLPETVHIFMEYVAAVSGIPVAILFGRSASGLNATGENDIKEWYDMLMGDRTVFYSSVFERLVKLIMLEKQGYFKGKELNDWFIEYGSLYEMSDKEKAEIYNFTSQADDRYINNNVVTSEEVRNRFTTKKFSPILTIND
jgi:hypothetical protein